ncbi:MAG: 4Fe-4S binding protein [Candidatus Nanoarchaeia archaeon]|jgi:pyruvate ferredoxin oxidoreductase delta subunit
MKKLKSLEMPIGGVIDKKASSLDYKTGDWKSFKPLRDKKKCTNCLLCAVFCPENCIKVKNGKVQDADLNYCKGCGICATQCPFKAIEMKKLEECDL